MSDNAWNDYAWEIWEARMHARPDSRDERPGPEELLGLEPENNVLGGVDRG